MGLTACTTTLAPPAARASAAGSASGWRSGVMPAGSPADTSRRTCASTRQPAASNARAAAQPRRPLAPRISTVGRVAWGIVEVSVDVSVEVSVAVFIKGSVGEGMERSVGRPRPFDNGPGQHSSHTLLHGTIP